MGQLNLFKQKKSQKNIFVGEKSTFQQQRDL